MKIALPFRWLASNTCGQPGRLTGLPCADFARAPLRASFTIPPDPCWASYHAVVTTAHPAAVAFRQAPIVGSASVAG